MLLVFPTSISISISNSIQSMFLAVAIQLLLGPAKILAHQLIEALIVFGKEFA